MVKCDNLGSNVIIWDYLELHCAEQVVFTYWGSIGTEPLAQTTIDFDRFWYIKMSLNQHPGNLDFINGQAEYSIAAD